MNDIDNFLGKYNLPEDSSEGVKNRCGPVSGEERKLSKTAPHKSTRPKVSQQNYTNFQGADHFSGI